MAKKELLYHVFRTNAQGWAGNYLGTFVAAEAVRFILIFKAEDLDFAITLPNGRLRSVAHWNQADELLLAQCEEGEKLHDAWHQHIQGG